MEEKYPCPKMNAKQRIENFWYYNKWFVLVGLVFFALILIATVQYVSKQDADASILYVGSATLSDEVCGEIIQSTESILFDANEDGKISVDMKNFVLHSDFQLLEREGQRIQAREESKEYSDEILSGDCCFLILDEYFYSELAESGALVNLYEIYSELPKSAIDYFGLRLGDTALYQLDGFSALPKDAIVCLKFSPVVAKESEEEKAQRDQVNREIFRILVG